MSKHVLFPLIAAAVLLAGIPIILVNCNNDRSDKSGKTETAKPGKPDTTLSQPASQPIDKKPFDPKDSLMEVNYRGMKFWVDRKTPRMTEAQANQIEEIIMTDKPPKQFERNAEINAYYLTLKAPGQNGSTGGYTKTSIGVLTSFCVQVPYKPLYRFLVYRADTEEGPWEQYADFIYETPAFPRIGFEVRGNELVCFDKHRSNKVMHTQKIAGKKH